MKSEILTVEEVNERGVKEQKHHLQMERASIEENLVKKEVSQLKALLLNRDLERVPPQINQAALIMSIIQGIFS